MNDQQPSSHEQIGRGSHPNIDAIYTAKYDALVSQILEGQSGVADEANPLVQVMGNKGPNREAPAEMLDDLGGFIDQFNEIDDHKLHSFLDDLDVLWDEENKVFYIGNTLGITDFTITAAGLEDIYFPQTLRVTSVTLRINSLTSVPILPPGIRRLDLGYNDIEILTSTSLPEGIQSLNLGSNPLKAIYGELPEGLRVLDLSDTVLPELNKIPKSLKSLNLESAKIKIIGDLGNLEDLYCSQITHQVAMCELPNTLKQLDISGSPYLGINKLPDALENLICDACEYGELPFAIPANLTYLDCSSNYLRDIPDVPNEMTAVNISDNPLTQAAIEECQQKGYTF